MNWLPIETAPKGGGAEMVSDPKWIEPPKLLLRFGAGEVIVGHWDWYYAEGGNGCTNGVAWVEPLTGERLFNYYGSPTHWISIDDIDNAIPRQAVADALAALQAKLNISADPDGINTQWNMALDYVETELDVTSAALGITGEKTK